jgi:hypothetical protein
MMTVTQRDVMVRNEYYKDQMRAAQRDRLARQAMARGNERGRICCAALAWLGRCLLVWGSSLQRRYGAVMSSSLPQPAKPEMSGHLG